MRTLAVLALCCLLMSSVTAHKPHPHNPPNMLNKCFKHNKTNFVDVGAMGGFAQRAFLKAHAAVLKELGCRGTVDYTLARGCYKTIEADGTKQLVGEYSFKYGFVAYCGRQNVPTQCGIDAVTVFNRGKLLLGGKFIYKCT